MIITDRNVFLCLEDLPKEKRTKDFDKLTVWDFMNTMFTIDHVNKAKLILLTDKGRKKFLKQRFR